MGCTDWIVENDASGHDDLSFFHHFWTKNQFHRFQNLLICKGIAWVRGCRCAVLRISTSKTQEDTAGSQFIVAGGDRGVCSHLKLWECKKFRMGFFVGLRLVILCCLISAVHGWGLWIGEGPPEGIGLRGERIDVGSLKVRDRLGKGRRALEEGVEQSWLLQIKGGHDSRVVERVGKILGVSNVQYIPHNSILVYASKERIDSARAALPEVVWAGVLQPHHKVDPELYPLLDDAHEVGGSGIEGWGAFQYLGVSGNNSHSNARRRLMGKGGGVELAVLMAKRAGAEETAKEWSDHLRWLGHEGVRVLAASPKKVIVIAEGDAGAADMIAWIAQHPHTLWVEKRPRFKLLNKWARGIMQGGNARKTPLWDRGLQGQGQILGIADTGVSMNLCFFWDELHPVPFNTVNLLHRKIISYQYDNYYGSRSDEEGHGTHTTGSLAGEAPAGSPEADFNGMAPKAKVFFDDIYAHGELSPPDDLEYDLFDGPYTHGAKVRSESWGGDSIFYTSSAMEADSFTHHHRDFLVVWAAGNEGDMGMFTIGSPATGKNMLSVGAQSSSSASMELQNSDTHFFEFRQGTDRSLGTEGFWGSFGPKTQFSGEVVKGFPVDGCDAMTNAAALQDKIVLVYRGVCTFTDKALRVQVRTPSCHLQCGSVLFSGFRLNQTLP